MCFS
ncbi:hypothetical protein TSAR_005566 [Trichomalopsis sarcophagae]|jgi:hypothetical protein